MTLYLWRDGDWQEAVKLPPAPRIHIITDSMAPLLHMKTGETFESKSAFRRATKAAGCVELGNDAPNSPAAPRPLQRDLRADLERVYSELEQGRPAMAGLPVEGEVRRYG